MIDLTTLEFRKQLAHKYAVKYSIDPALVAAVVEHESSWNPWAQRYEDGFFHRYIHPANPDKPTTEQLNESQSFGLMQVMGAVARELGFQGKYLTELCDPDVGMEFGCKKLRHCLDKHPNDEVAALLAYNGGSDPNYPIAVQYLKSKY